LNEWPLPKETYYMSGGGGQKVFIVPSHQLVIVRLGHFRGNEPGMKALKKAQELLLQAILLTR
jgi:CubicO group peptidase (beta-lactamase class C family)